MYNTLYMRPEMEVMRDIVLKGSTSNHKMDLIVKKIRNEPCIIISDIYHFHII
jgi:hypothetical protein